MIPLIFASALVMHAPTWSEVQQYSRYDCVAEYDLNVNEDQEEHGTWCLRPDGSVSAKGLAVSNPPLFWAWMIQQHDYEGQIAAAYAATAREPKTSPWFWSVLLTGTLVYAGFMWLLTRRLAPGGRDGTEG